MDCVHEWRIYIWKYSIVNEAAWYWSYKMIASRHIVSGSTVVSEKRHSLICIFSVN